MFPSRFDYAAPGSLDEALGILGEQPDETKILAGGQSLIPLLKFRFAAPAKLVDINRVAGLDSVEEANGHLRIGTLARHNQIAADSLIGRSYPTIAAAAPLIADPLVRNLGTVGGSLAHGDPAGDWGSVMLALNAEVVARGPTGERVIPIDEFFIDIFTTSLNEDEIVTEVRVPQPQGSLGGTYLKLERKVVDYATVGVAVHLELDGDTVSGAGLGLTAVGARNIKAAGAEEALKNNECSDELFAEAGRLAAEAADPVSDVRGSAAYKRAVVETFVKRGLAEAHDRARAN